MTISPDKHAYVPVVYLPSLDWAPYYVSYFFYFVLNFKTTSISNFHPLKKVLILGKDNNCPVQWQLK